VGGTADIEEAIGVMRELRLTSRVARLFSGGLMTIPDVPEANPPAANPPAEGEIAYAVGNLMHENGRDREAKDAYRLALKIHPEHGWAANNLGYFLAEAGENIAEADRLLELAVRLLPDEASVIDSLGWLRYLEGQLADRGERLGAVTLLKRAADLSGRLNGTHLDHLGDATWRMGDREGARKLWTEAEALVQMELDERRARAGALGRGNNGEGLDAASASVRRATEQLEAVRAKVRAARAGEEPKVAPTFAERGIAVPAEIGGN
jgi:tetratricopeptide (TPR) repeat protein